MLSSFFYPVVNVCFAHVKKLTNLTSAYSGIIDFYCTFPCLLIICYLLRIQCISFSAITAAASSGSGRIESKILLVIFLTAYWAYLSFFFL